MGDCFPMYSRLVIFFVGHWLRMGIGDGFISSSLLYWGYNFPEMQLYPVCRSDKTPTMGMLWVLSPVYCAVRASTWNLNSSPWQILCRRKPSVIIDSVSAYFLLAFGECCLLSSILKIIYLILSSILIVTSKGWVWGSHSLYCQKWSFSSSF